VAVMRQISNAGGISRGQLFAIVGGFVLVVVVPLMFWPASRPPEAAEEETPPPAVEPIVPIPVLAGQRRPGELAAIGTPPEASGD